jgi:hypothetical protein
LSFYPGLTQTYLAFSTLIGAPDFTDLSCFTSPLALPQENVALLAALARLAEKLVLAARQDFIALQTKKGSE